MRNGNASHIDPSLPAVSYDEQDAALARLPPEVRKFVLCEAISSYDVPSIERFVVENGADRTLWKLAWARKQYTRAAYGDDHPEARRVLYRAEN